jgi:2-deoxy-D-gluconate 3-dehydrogenase
MAGCNTLHRQGNSMMEKLKRGFDLSGKVAIVTGAASGIGLAVAELFADCGANTVLLDRHPSVAELPASLNGGVGKHMALTLDVSDATAVIVAIQQVVQRFGKIDILINNAGLALLEPALDLSEADWDKTMAVNLKAPFILAQAAGRHMIERGYGRIVNLASQASVIALERHVAYCASKAALVGMSKVLALEWAAHGVTVNAVSPTVVETELGKKAWAGAVGAAMKARIPTGRFARPEEVAALILYLASDAAAMINGENILIDGGYTAQ